MGDILSVRFEGFDRLQRRMNMLDHEINAAASMAINKTAAKAKTEMVRAIASEYAITQREVRPKMRVFRASRMKLKAVLDPWGGGRKRSLNVIHFLEKKVTLAEGRRRKKAGTQNELRFKIKKRGSPKTIKGAFIGNKGRTIFRRTGKSRLPIESVQTLGVPQMFGVRRINERVLARIRKELPIEADRAVRRILDRRA